jgi:NTP pyrophosphatase (non-canonical NTP hydrolase)
MCPQRLPDLVSRFCLLDNGRYENDNLAISLSLEGAEILEHFQFREEPKDKEEFASELADVTLYLLQLASVSGIDLEKAVLKKIEINKTRQWDVKE